MKELTNTNDVGIYPWLVTQHKAIPKTKKTQWLTSVHLILSSFSLSRKGKMCHYSSQQLAITQRLRIKKNPKKQKTVGTTWNKKDVFSVIQRNWFMKYLKSQNRCIAKSYTMDTHTRLRTLVLSSFKVLIKADDSKVMFHPKVTMFSHMICQFYLHKMKLYEEDIKVLSPEHNVLQV